MRPYSTLLLIAAVLLVSVGLWCQDGLRDPHHDPDMLARLSYNSTPIVQGEHICVAVSREGDYRFVRFVRFPNGINNGLPLRLQGKMPKEQLQQLKMLLESSEFRSLAGNHGGGLIREEAESFRAEIPTADGQAEHNDGAKRLEWLNAEGESPFPGSVAKVVKWLKQFDPKGGESFDYAEFQDVCPSGGLRLVQPSVAENQHP
jgi:hypothetical protein